MANAELATSGSSMSSPHCERLLVDGHELYSDDEEVVHHLDAGHFGNASYDI